MRRREAVFLDKDGTLIENIPYNVNPGAIVLAPGALEGLQLLYAAGFQLIVVTNQPGVAYGYFMEQALQAVEERLRQLLAQGGVPLAGFLYCPHHPEGAIADYAIACTCRKPQPGLLLRAAADQHIDLQKSWLIGDILHDVEAGNHAGCRTILIDNGNETEWRLSHKRLPHYTTATLSEAARVILAVREREVNNELNPPA